MEAAVAPRVSTYNLTASNGRHVRVATMVTLSDGTEVRFTERMGKAEALRNLAREMGRR